MQLKNSPVAKAKETYNKFLLNWHIPPLGKYVPYKEVFAYGFGGMGVQFIIYFSSLIALSATSFLVGNTIGIKPVHLQLMSVASTAVGFGITIVRSYIIDSSKFKSGKFRPWLATMGIPTVIISIVFVWLPYETMSYSSKVAAVFICFNLLQCFYPFYQQAYTDLANVISPNSHERTDIISVSSVIYSFAPSLTGTFVPLLSQLTGGLNNITTYRIIHPIVSVVGLALCYIAVFGTKERIIVAKTHVSHFKFTDAFRSVARNKYFWITSLAGWLGFLEGAVAVIIGWTFIYGYPNRMGTYSIATTLIGNAALWSMIICPFAIRKLGKRNLLICSNVANIFLIALLYPLYRNIYALIAIYYLNGFVSSFAIVYNPGINADMRDYQQYFTGERIDGMFGAVGIIGSFVGMFTGLMLPLIYETLGLRDNYDVLEVASFREDMFQVLIIAAVIGAALNCVPYFFYDLTEIKQRSIVKVLKIRALFEDYGNGVLRDDALVEAIDIIDEANELYQKRAEVTTKDDIKKAKQLAKDTPDGEAKLIATKEAYRSFKKKMKAVGKSEKKLAEDIAVSDFVVDEMHKFTTARVMCQVERANADITLGIDGIRNAPKSLIKNAKTLPKETHEQREIRSDAIAHARAVCSCKKYLCRYYSGIVIAPDESATDRAEELPQDTFKQRIERKKTIRQLVNERSHYTRSVKILLDARRILAEQHNYAHLDEIRAKYDEAKLRNDEDVARKKAENDRLEQQRKEDMERRKLERAARKQGSDSDD